MRLHLVRHGQSSWNLEHRLQGQAPGIPLTVLGCEQAAAAAQALIDLGLQGSPIWSSDLERALETAKIISSRIGTEIGIDQRLREQSYGVLEGRLTKQLQAEPVPEGFDITEVAWGGGESIKDVYSRIRSFLLELDTNAEDAVLVTHGDALRVALTVIDQLNRGEPDNRPHRLVAWPVVANGSVTSVELI